MAGRGRPEMGLEEAEGRRGLRTQVHVPLWVLMAGLAGIGLCLLFVFWLYNAVSGGHPLTTFGYEVSKALFVSSTAGALFSWLLRPSFGGYGNIARTYPSRVAAKRRFIELVRKASGHVYIAGISERDFLTAGGSLTAVWEAICERLDSEQVTPGKERLRVRILLLDPDSSEGRLRRQIEGAGQLGLRTDVQNALQAVNAQVRRLGDIGHHRAEIAQLQAHLYDHCPFAFFFVTGDAALVQQYVYRKTAAPSELPLIEYPRSTREYDEIVGSLEQVWRWSYRSHSTHDVGVAAGVEEAHIRNIYRVDQRPSLGQRELEAIMLTRAPATVDILALTGKFYRTALTARPDRTAWLLRPSSPTIRLALVNPVSQQAILRAVADEVAPKDIARTLASWTWSQHQKAALFSDVELTIATVENINQAAPAERAARPPIELRLYSSAPTCALIRTSGAIFVEQYVYGRSAAFGGTPLGREYPVLEFQPVRGGVERALLDNAFQVIWDSFSVDVARYAEDDHEARFEANLRALQEEMALLQRGVTAPTGGRLRLSGHHAPRGNAGGGRGTGRRTSGVGSAGA